MTHRPTDLPETVVRLVPVEASSSTSVRWTDQVVGRLGEPVVTGCLEGDHHLAEDVALSLADGGVADPHRARPGIPGQVVELALRAAVAPPSTAYMICRSCGVAGDRAQQPVAPEPGLLDVPDASSASRVSEASRSQQYR